MNLSNLRIAGYQMLVTADVDANLEKIRAGIAAAAANGAEVFVAPECAVSGYGPLHYTDSNVLDMDHIERANEEVARLCGQHGMWGIIGTTTRRTEKLFNTALVIDASGNVIGTYDKAHLIGDDPRFYEKGSAVPVFDFGGAKFGVQICYDSRFPEPFRYLKEQGAAVVFCIFNACGGATWKVPVLEGTCRCRAAENNIYMVAVNAAGPLQMVVSRICDTDGLSLAAANQDKEEIIYATLDLTSVGDGFFADRRTDLFHVSSTLGKP